MGSGPQVKELEIKLAGLKLFCGSVQGFGGSLNGQRARGIADAAETSFFPAKLLRCFSDGGTTFTNDDDLANTLRSIRVHGQGSNKHENLLIGVNLRLDTIQAAILPKKLEIFPDEIEKNEAAAPTPC